MKFQFWIGVFLPIMAYLFLPKAPATTSASVSAPIATPSVAASSNAPAVPFPGVTTPPPSPAASPSPNGVQYAVKVEDATWCVAGINPQNGEELCASGFAINPDEIAGVDTTRAGRYVVTNFHVVANTGPEPLVSYQGKAKDGGEEFGRGEVLKQDPERDLALVFIPDASSPIAKLAEALPQEEGTWMKAIGFPDNAPLTIKETSFRGMGSDCLAMPPCIRMDQSTITHGNSGGPLAAREADLGGSPSNPEQEVIVGVNEGETVDEIAIPIDQVRGFLQSKENGFAGGGGSDRSGAPLNMQMERPPLGELPIDGRRMPPPEIRGAGGRRSPAGGY